MNWSISSVVFVFCLALPAISGAAGPNVVRRGEYLFRVTGCANCHTENPAQPLAGGAGITVGDTTFYPPNITMDPEAGIGNWTDADFIQALRKGVSPKGNSYFPAFPFESYSQLADEDMLAIKAYIATLPRSSQRNRGHDLPFYLRRTLLGDGNPLLFAWRENNTMMQARRGEITPQNFMAFEGPFSPLAGRDPVWNRGAYLVEGALHCTQCHTPRTSAKYLDLSQWMGGSFSEDMSAPNITPAATAFAADWSEADWDTFLVTGRSPIGSEASGEMAKVVKTQTSALSKEDRIAVVRYLRSLPRVETK